MRNKNVDAPEDEPDGFIVQSLSDREVVVALIAQFCTEIESVLHSLWSGNITKEEFTERSKALVRANAEIFSGNHPGFKTAEENSSLKHAPMLKGLLGEFWAKRHQAWGDDHLAVFFEWLFVMVAEQIKRADGDDMLLEVMLKPIIQQAVQVLHEINKN